MSVTGHCRVMVVRYLPGTESLNCWRVVPIMRELSWSWQARRWTFFKPELTKSSVCRQHRETCFSVVMRTMELRWPETSPLIWSGINGESVSITNKHWCIYLCWLLFNGCVVFAVFSIHHTCFIYRHMYSWLVSLISQTGNALACLQRLPSCLGSHIPLLLWYHPTSRTM